MAASVAVVPPIGSGLSVGVCGCRVVVVVVVAVVVCVGEYNARVPHSPIISLFKQCRGSNHKNRNKRFATTRTHARTHARI